MKLVKSEKLIVNFLKFHNQLERFNPKTHKTAHLQIVQANTQSKFVKE
jgi:hypothetical protein